jgi:hypothetical protein
MASMLGSQLTEAATSLTACAAGIIMGIIIIIIIIVTHASIVVIYPIVMPPLHLLQKRLR